MAPKDAMEVEEAEKVLPKIKADDDPDNEGAYMRLALLRFRLTRCAARLGTSADARARASRGGECVGLHARQGLTMNAVPC